MATWVYATDNGAAGFTFVAGAVRWTSLVGDFFTNNEPITQVLVRGTYTAKNLWLNCTSVAGTCTVIDRKNGAAGSQSISITTTGAKEYTGAGTSLAAGDLFGIQATMSAGHSDACTYHAQKVGLDDGGSNIPILAAGTGGVGGSISPTSAGYGSLVGSFNSGQVSTETNVQVRTRVGLVLSNFRLYISSNTFTADQTFWVRIDAANGNQTISLAAGSTGSKEDITNTDTVTAGQALCWKKDTGTGTGNGNVSIIQVTASGTAMPSCPVQPAGLSLTTASESSYYALHDRIVKGVTEANAQVKVGVVDTYSRLQANVPAVRATPTTINLRVNSASPGGGPSLSVTATGALDDLTGTVTTGTTSLICYRILTGTGSDTFLATFFGAHQGTISVAAKSLLPPLVHPQFVRKRNRIL